MVLEDKCRLYQKMNTEESSPRYTRDLETKCLRLQQQLSEMEVSPCTRNVIQSLRFSITFLMV